MSAAARPFLPANTQNSPALALVPPLSSAPQAHRQGGWREGDPAGERRFADLGGLTLENGDFLPHVRLAYETWGTLNEDRSNAILILHALTGDAHVCGSGGEATPGQSTAGWWNEVVGPGCAIDTAQHFVVGVNVLGGCQGSTGPSSSSIDGLEWGSRFPLLTTRDQVSAEALLADHLGIERWHTVIGASLGGQRAYEWAVSHPERLERLIIVASSAQASAEQAAWAHTQIQAITLDPSWQGGDYYASGEAPTRGLALARQIAHTTYRAPEELAARFGNEAQQGENPLVGGRLAIASYLDYHGEKLVRRFDAGSYVALCRTMITHDVGRGRGGLERALGRVRAETLVIGVDSDRLFYPQEVRACAQVIPGAHYVEITSACGHDGFLIESDQVSDAICRFYTNSVLND